MPTEHAELESALKLPTAAERDQTLKAIAVGAIGGRNWSLAAAALAKVEAPDAACQLQLNLTRNFAAMQQHRPAVYDALIAAKADPRFQIAASETGLPTILFTNHAGQTTSLSPGNNPLQGVGAMFSRLKNDLAQGVPLALCGVGDGYLINALAQKPPKLHLTMQHTVHIIEPMPQVLLLCMMMHDYTGDAGPIAQPRFRWHVGDTWQQQITDDVLGDLLTPFPMVNVSQGVDTHLIVAGLNQLRDRMLAEDLRRKHELDAYYNAITREQWVNLFGSFPDRPPRVLLITTRFSTVLQYSTRDAAQAFGQLGWETCIAIEPSDWQRHCGAGLRKVMYDFRPDLIFQIDHLRSEHNDLYPPQLPFVCWIQDHLPNLCNHEAGRSVGMRDFILSNLASLFVQQHGYPRRQMIDLPQLSRVPMRPTEWTSDGEDLIYVSNWSKPAADVATELVQRFSSPAPLRALMELVKDVLIDIYASGGAVPTYHDIRNIVTECENISGVTIYEPPLKNTVINAVFDSLNGTLYRHQALQWAVEVARERNLKLGLYGRGWNDNPQFAEFARGPVTPGEDLERLNRAAKINLQLEPYACFSHARLTSGLFAGGFFLIRDHPLNHLPQELLNFVDRVFDPSVCTVDEARRVVKDHHREKLEEMLARCACLGEQIDPISLVRDWQRNGTLIPHGCSLPRMGEVLFRDKAGFAAAVERYIDNAPLRYDISTEQRQHTQSRLSYRAGMEKVTRAIAKLIATEPQQQGKQAA